MLGNPLGIKVGDRETRDIVDIWSIMPAGARRARLFRSEHRQARLQDPARGRRARRRAQPRSDARASPGRPTCTIPSSRPGCTASTCRRCSCGARPTASSSIPITAAPMPPLFPARGFETIERAGHYPHIEQPDEFARASLAFAEQKQPAKAREPRRKVYAGLSVHRAGLLPGLERPRGLAAHQPAEQQARSQDRRRPVQPLLRRVADRRRARPRHHAQRASPDRDLHVVDGASSACRSWRATPRRRGCWCSAIRSATGPIRCAAPRSSRPSTWSRAAASTWASSRACPTNSRRRTRTRSA